VPHVSLLLRDVGTAPSNQEQNQGYGNAQ